MKYQVYVLILLIFASCQTRNNGEPDTAIVPIRLEWDKVVDELDYSSMVEDSVLVIPLETRDDCLIGEMTKMVYQNNLIYVSDNVSKAIYVFDETGKLVTKLRAVGNGPGEYLNITSFVVRGTDIVIYDHFASRLLFYNAKGEFIKTEDAKDVWGMDIVSLGDKIWFVNDGGRLERGFYHLFSVNADKAGEHDAFLPFQDPGEQGWGTDDYLAPLKDEALFYYFPFDTLYTLKDNKAYPSYVVDFGKKRLPQQYIHADGRTALKAAIRDHYIGGVDRVVQSDNYIFILFSDCIDSYTAIYDKRTGGTIITKDLFNKKLGDLALQLNFRYIIQDENIIQYYPIEHWNVQVEYGDPTIIDKQELYSEHLRRQYREFQQMDGTECNPVVFIQKLKK